MKNKKEIKRPIALPNSSLKNKTGAWRTYQPKIDREKCIGCSLCATICPEATIKMIDRKAVINYDYCKGCGLCARECPVKAIIMEQEKK